MDPTANMDKTSPAFSSVIPNTLVRKNEVSSAILDSAAPTISRVSDEPLKAEILSSIRGSIGSFTFHCV
ncbi:hypothetical protein D3C80_2097680 [compost metagenome]